MYVCVIKVRGPRVHQSLSGNSIYSSGPSAARTTTTECTPMLCMVLFQAWLVYRVKVDVV